jgi:hypothetical protein
VGGGRSGTAATIRSDSGVTGSRRDASRGDTMGTWR